MDDELLREAMSQAAPERYMSQPGEVIEYYKDTYGARGWTHAIAAKMHELGLIRGRTGEVSSIRNIQRRFQGGRLEKELARRNSPLYEQLGRALPPVGRDVPSQITVTVTALQEDRERAWTAAFRGAEAYEFANSPSLRKFFEHLGYPDSVIDEFEGDDSGGLDILDIDIR
jgi:hypothetical protein